MVSKDSKTAEGGGEKGTEAGRGVGPHRRPPGRGARGAHSPKGLALSWGEESARPGQTSRPVFLFPGAALCAFPELQALGYFWGDFEKRIAQNLGFSSACSTACCPAHPAHPGPCQRHTVMDSGAKRSCRLEGPGDFLGPLSKSTSLSPATMTIAVTTGEGGHV